MPTRAIRTRKLPIVRALLRLRSWGSARAMWTAVFAIFGLSAIEVLHWILPAPAGRSAPSDAALQSISLTDADTELPPALRVCAHPDNMPFSNAKGQGVENVLAELVARDLARPLAYTWWPRRVGFVRATLGAGKCDVVMGVPVTQAAVATTRPYYRSAFVFVTRGDRQLQISSLDDPSLLRLRVGVHEIGDNAGLLTTPTLSQRGIVRNVRHFGMDRDDAQALAPRALINAVSRDEIDVAIAWGPLAGYLVPRSSVPLLMHPVTMRARDAGAESEVALMADIAMAVRPGDIQTKAALEAFLDRHEAEIAALLARFDFPVMPMDHEPHLPLPLPETRMAEGTLAAADVRSR